MGILVDFNVYVGASAAGNSSKHGLGYDVVMKLVNPYLNQGYHLYLDNFYTSPQLVRDLFLKGTLSIGTGKVNREGFPSVHGECEGVGKEKAARYLTLVTEKVSLSAW